MRIPDALEEPADEPAPRNTRDALAELMARASPPELQPMTAAEAAAAIGRCVEMRATRQLATVERVVREAVLIRYDDGAATHWVNASSLFRRPDLDDRVLPRRRSR